jgi:serine/threonine protein kinase/formylglycine-generating enzyme required for sulfatase activity
MDGTLVKDRYLVQRKLGQGGFAVTYLASDTHLDSRLVVVKILLEHRSDDAWVLKKFRQEAQALARLDHPGIVAALDWGELSDGKPFLVMQFIKGVTLRQEITPRGMPLERAAHIVRQLGQALTAAHDCGICHRDVKPENIMLQSFGEFEEQAKLLDFGIASVRDPVSPTSGGSATISGSLGYMAPEQFEGRSSVCSDVYALGVVAYEMLTGRQPFNGDSVAQLVALQLQGVKVKPKDLRPSLPKAAQDCILKALSRDPQARYGRARDFGEALARALAPEAIVAPQPEIHGGETTTIKQKLEIAHVLYMDLVESTTLPMDQQTKNVRLLQRVVGETPEFRKAELDRQLMRLPTGDGMALVFFGDPELPVRCALSIAVALKPLPELKLRMGVHSGPVYRVADINTNANVTGGGISMAQRVMDCGDAGHILLSRAAAEVLVQLSDWAPRLHDLGEYSVKHGVKLHLYNLYTADIGNRNVPEKLRPAQPQPVRVEDQAQAAPVPPVLSDTSAVSRETGSGQTPPSRRYLVAVSLTLAVIAGVAASIWWFYQRPRPPSVGSGSTQGSTAATKRADAPVSPPQSAASASDGANVASPAVTAPAEPSHPIVNVNPKDGQRYIWIQPGTFTMGCSPGDDECSSDEKPPHPVTIAKGFWIGETGVTQEAYQRVKGSNPSKFKGAKLPVEWINWNEAQAYCQAIGLRLPTESEWEYAARAGSTGMRYGEIDQIAWYGGNSGSKTHEVGQKQANAWGLYDMLGNVWQWTSDWYADQLPGASVEPAAPASRQYRALRGGSWTDSPWYLRVSNRNRYAPGYRSNNIGFRCAGQ